MKFSEWCLMNIDRAGLSIPDQALWAVAAVEWANIEEGGLEGVPPTNNQATGWYRRAVRCRQEHPDIRFIEAMRITEEGQ